MSARLTVLIATHGRPTLLARTLASVAACARPPGYAGCVVVENGPPAGAEAVVAELAAAHPEAGLRYLHHGRANKSAALNAALAALTAPSSGEGAEAEGPDGGHLVVFFDDDVRVSPGALAAYAEVGAGHPEAAYFGGPVVCDYEAEPPQWLLPLLPASARGVDAAEAERMGYFLGINWAAWVSDAQALGGFNPAYGPGSPTGARGQESEMQGRMRLAGMRSVFVPDAAVWHYVPRARCSPTWVIQRSYRSAVLLGHNARQGRGRRNVKRSALGIASHPFRAVWGALRADDQLRTEATASLAHSLGYLRGYFASPRDR